MVHIPDVWQIQHVGLSVLSIDKSLSIYRDILGMEVALDTEITGDHLKEHFLYPLGLDHKKLRVAFVKSATGVWLELFQFSDPSPRLISSESRFSDIGICQIALEVKDIEETINKLEAKGIAFIYPLFNIENPDGYKVKLRSFRDPDGIFVELVQVRGADNLTQKQW